jgi:acyl carrier protein
VALVGPPYELKRSGVDTIPRPVLYGHSAEPRIVLEENKSVDAETSLQEFIMTTLAAAANIERCALSEETSMLELGIDSLTLAGLVAQVEMRYGCEVPLEQVYELFDAPLVRDVVTVVGRYAEGATGRLPAKA